MKTSVKLLLLQALVYFLFMPVSLSANNRSCYLLQQIYTYPTTFKAQTADDSVSYSYMKYSYHVLKRNVFLMTVPTMYAVSREIGRQFMGESFHKMTLLSNGSQQIERLLSVSTVPGRQNTLPTMEYYLTPSIYQESMIRNGILSPFHKKNKRYYQFSASKQDSLHHKLVFKPKINNTLLIDGYAIVHSITGRIVSTKFSGEYDMIRFNLTIDMGQEDCSNLLPLRCRLNAKFSFMGNDVRGTYTMLNNLPNFAINNDIKNNEWAYMEHLRPEPLTAYETKLYEPITKAIAPKKTDSITVDTLSAKHKFTVQSMLWDIISDNIMNDIKQKIGKKQQGYVRISPILNPLYMEYSPSQGVLYKFNIRGGYQFTPNQDIWLQFRGNYSFKLDQFYFYLPIQYYFDKRKNGYIESIYSTGRRIRNRRIITEMLAATNNNPIWESMRLDEFKATYWDFDANYNFSEYVGLQAGFILHNRTAVSSTGLRIINKPTQYQSLAPKIELTLRPLGLEGPIFLASYESCIKHFGKTTMPYTRWEFDGQYAWPISNVRTLTLRLGSGFYTNRDENSYFVDFEHFREPLINNGWSYEWAGEFQLLRSDMYNSSKYYIRNNITYQSPFLALSWLPVVGHVIERERFYLNLLKTQTMKLYTEVGYSIKTHYFSAGVFASIIEKEYKGIGFTFEMELFKHW